MSTLQLEPITRLGLCAPAEWCGPEGSLVPDDEPSPQESLLTESSLSSGMSLGLGEQDLAEGPWPCLASELEEQAKALEDEWLYPGHPPAAVSKAQQGFRPAAAALGPPTLKHSALEVVQRQRAAQEEAEQQRKQQQQQQRQEGVACGATECCGEAPVREEPCTPQRHSKGESCWSESPLPSALDELAEVQSPAPAKLMSLPGADAPADCIAFPAAAAVTACGPPPLALAIDNAQRVRLGQEPLPGAWRGCGRSAWCSLLPRHRDCCNGAAVVPGLLAYPSHELFESGVNIEELCRVPEELLCAGGPLSPDAESEGEAGQPCGSATAAADCLSSGKRRLADGEAERDGSASPSHSGCGTSSGGAGEVAQQPHATAAAATAAIKRLRTDAASPASLAAFQAVPMASLAPAALQPSPAAVAAAAAEVAAAVCPRMVPVAVPTPVIMPQFAPPVPLPAPSLGSAVSRNRGRPAGAPRLRPLPRVDTPPVPPPAPAAPTPSKPVTRQKTHSPATGAPVAPRTSGRRTVLQWHTESVVDPRTGATVTEVQPGTFCTQCYALSTPVWRAGPFGSKTLCNACGVRWMKASKGTKK